MLLHGSHMLPQGRDPEESDIPLEEDFELLRSDSGVQKALQQAQVKTA